MTRTRTRIQITEHNKTQIRTKQDVNKNANNRIRTKTRTWIEYKENDLDRIELVSRVEALIPDDVIVTKSGSLDTNYGDLDDATSEEGR